MSVGEWWCYGFVHKCTPLEKTMKSATIRVWSCGSRKPLAQPYPNIGYFSFFIATPHFYGPFTHLGIQQECRQLSACYKLFLPPRSPKLLNKPSNYQSRDKSCARHYNCVRQLSLGWNSMYSRQMELIRNVVSTLCILGLGDNWSRLTIDTWPDHGCLWALSSRAHCDCDLHQTWCAKLGWTEVVLMPGVVSPPCSRAVQCAFDNTRCPNVDCLHCRGWVLFTGHIWGISIMRQLTPRIELSES